MNIIFVLYKPAVPENIGAAARAIKTMGFSELRLINPVQHLCSKSLKMAHGSKEILENAKVFENYDQAFSDIDFIIGTTAKKRSVKGDYHPASKLPAILQEKAGTIVNAGIVFGTEESGLPNEILLNCHISSSVPMAAGFPSLNLAQSVMIYAYELSVLRLNNKPSEPPNLPESEFRELQNRVKELMEILEITSKTPVYYRILERMSLLNSTDIHLLHSLTSRIISKL